MTREAGCGEAVSSPSVGTRVYRSKVDFRFRRPMRWRRLPAFCFMPILVRRTQNVRGEKSPWARLGAVRLRSALERVSPTPTSS